METTLEKRVIKTKNMILENTSCAATFTLSKGDKICLFMNTTHSVIGTSEYTRNEVYKIRYSDHTQNRKTQHRSLKKN